MNETSVTANPFKELEDAITNLAYTIHPGHSTKQRADAIRALLKAIESKKSYEKWEDEMGEDL